MFSFLFRHRQLIVYGVLLAVLLFLLRWLEIRFIIIEHAFEVYAGVIALLFTFLGIWLATRLIRPRVHRVVIEEDQREPVGLFTADQTQVEKAGLSRREIEVLSHMAGGLSNQEIAGKLFVSLNTVKTHSSNLFEKLGVKRRTQAVEKARRLGIIP